MNPSPLNHHVTADVSGRVVAVDLLAPAAAPRDRSTSRYRLTRDFVSRLRRIPGYRDLDGRAGEFACTVTFTNRCQLNDEALSATVRRCAALSVARRGERGYDSDLLCDLFAGSRLGSVKTSGAEFHLAPDVLAIIATRPIAGAEVQTLCGADLADDTLGFGTLGAAVKFGSICRHCADRVELRYLLGHRSEPGEATHCLTCPPPSAPDEPVYSRSPTSPETCGYCDGPLHGRPVDPFTEPPDPDPDPEERAVR